MDRRTFISGAAAAVFAAPFPAEAQRTETMPRIGYLSPGVQGANDEVFWAELRRLGYAEGKNIFVEYRSADGDFEKLPGLAKELVSLKVDIIVAVVTQASLAAKQATATIPIVMVSVSDPLTSGLVGNLARPGGNITGTSGIGAGVVAKQLELLHTLLPDAALVVALWNPANSVFQQQLIKEATLAAAKLRVRLQLVEARTPEELDRTFAAINKYRPSALLVLTDPLFGLHAKRIADLALKQHLPAVGGERRFAEAGVVATYGAPISDAYRRAAAYTEKILKGAKPGDLPIEQPTAFQLVINLKTAKALGLTIPQSVLLRTDEVIQ